MSNAEQGCSGAMPIQRKSIVPSAYSSVVNAAPQWCQNHSVCLLNFKSLLNNKGCLALFILTLCMTLNNVA